MTMNDFVLWLKEQLEERGWTRAELSRRSGISAAQISRIFAMEQRAGEVACNGIARALGIPADEVFRRAGLLPETSKSTEASQKLVDLIPLLSENDVLVLIRMAETMAKETAVKHTAKKGSK